MIYLDSAATSLYKPETVQTAVLDAINKMASPGRGTHSAAMRAAECCFDCRLALAKLMDVSEPERVIFTFNATHALNIAIHSLVKRGTRVLISGYEHNAVTRPLHSAEAEIRVIETPLFDAAAFLAETERYLSWAEVMVCTHVSNVFGYILPIKEVAAACRRHGVPLIVDASQSAGILDIDVRELGAAFVAMPGHKGLMGPQGTGVLICQNDATPLLYGGSGSASILQTMPEELPDRLEAGTQNVTGIAGLLAGVRYILERGTAAICAHEQMLTKILAEGLSETDLKLYYNSDPELQSSVLSVQPRRMDCEVFAEALEREGVAVRTGLHCAPTAHRTAGTLERGTVRFSFSPFNTVSQTERTVEICKKILKNP